MAVVLRGPGSREEASSRPRLAAAVSEFRPFWLCVPKSKTRPGAEMAVLWLKAGLVEGRSRVY